ncbi:MAG: bHLH/Zip transcription factor [Piccolia ochrophora]|nr:MAG: bHLH/Zip transcription factor [Piccolia ochrophora]
MAGAGSASPYIKDEPEESIFNSSQAQPFSNRQQQGYAAQQHHSFDQFANSNGSAASIDPSELTMSGGNVPMSNGNFISSFPSFGSQTNLNFNLTNAGIADDELLDLGNLDDNHGNHGGFEGESNDVRAQSELHHDQSVHQPFSNQNQGGPFSMNNSAQVNSMYSHTPEGAPIQSPFIQQNFNYDHYRQMAQQQPQFANSKGPSSYNPSHGPQGSHSGSVEGIHMNARSRSKMHPAFERNGSHSKSPLTPKTPGIGINTLNLETSDPASFPSQPIHTLQPGQHRHQRNFSSQWDSNSGSLHSYVDSPLSSPGQPSHHPQISDVLKSGKHASLPAKVENGPLPGYQTQEAKRRRRRESHNMVERRRRDNINERIQELSHLVPQHRLEDEKVRKHLVNNSPLSPTLGSTSMSPPQATSLLAGGSGRRAAGNITTGLPVEEKDKGPNKGDILNGSVGWTRDLMWSLYAKIQQESELVDYITSLGGTYPFEQTEEEKRMRTELLDAMEKNDPSTFSYSRAQGTGLRVPKHTNLSGDPLGQNNMSPQSLSPANISGGSANASVTQGQGQGQFWSGNNSGGSGHGSVSFKGEDDYSMDMS